MKALRVTLIALLAMGSLADLSSAQPAMMALPQPVLASFAVGVQTGGFDLFYSNLSPYGQWVNRPSYGWVWAPRRVAASWRPYTRGHWVYTDYGWTWMSSEPWGWATYHYGRWNFDSDYGWTWVPGTDWGPAWVSFQEGGGYFGWAPLPPAVGWDASVGLALGGFDLSVGIAPSYWSFCPQRSFLAANVYSAIVPWQRNVTIIRNTRNITNYTVVNGRVVNRSLAVEHVQQVTGRPVPRFALTTAASPRQMGVHGNQVALFRPAIAKRNLDPPPQVLRESNRAANARPPQAAGRRQVQAHQKRQAATQRQAVAQRSRQRPAGVPARSHQGASQPQAQRQAARGQSVAQHHAAAPPRPQARAGAARSPQGAAAPRAPLGAGAPRSQRPQPRAQTHQPSPRSPARPNGQRPAGQQHDPNRPPSAH